MQDCDNADTIHHNELNIIIFHLKYIMFSFNIPVSALVKQNRGTKKFSVAGTISGQVNVSQRTWCNYEIQMATDCNVR